MKTKLLRTTTFLLAATLAVPTLADVLTVRAEFPAEVMIPNTTSSASVDTTYTARLAQFNPALGTLNSIKFTLDFDFEIILTGDLLMGGSGGGSVVGEVYVNDQPEVFIGGGNGGGGGVGPGMEWVIPVPQLYMQTAVPGGSEFGDAFAGEFIGTGEVEIEYIATGSVGPSSGAMRIELTDTPPAFMSITYDFTPAQPSALQGDYNADGRVDAADYTVWRNNLGMNVLLPGDATPGTVDIGDYAVWKQQFGQSAEGAIAIPPVHAVPAPHGFGWLAATMTLAPFGKKWAFFRRRDTARANDQIEKQLQ